LKESAMRFPRSMHDVFPWHGVVTHYRRPLADRVVSWVCNLVLLAVLGAIGVLLAWRG